MNELDVSGLSALPDVIKYRNYDGTVSSLDPKKILQFDGNNIPFETQATTYFMVTQLAEIASLTVNNKKAELGRIRSNAYLAYAKDKDIQAQYNGRKPTDAMLNAMVDITPEVIQATKNYNEARFKYNTLNNLMRAFEQRKDLMQSMSAKKRIEMNTGQNNF